MFTANGTEEVLQIIPADQWLAEYESDGEPLLLPLVGWALLEDSASKQRNVVGLVVTDDGVSAADAADNFLGYVHRTEAGK